MSGVALLSYLIKKQKELVGNLKDITPVEEVESNKSQTPTVKEEKSNKSQTPTVKEEKSNKPQSTVNTRKYVGKVDGRKYVYRRNYEDLQEKIRVKTGQKTYNNPPYYKSFSKKLGGLNGRVKGGTTLCARTAREVAK
jgi:hypothetical protein